MCVFGEHTLHLCFMSCTGFFPGPIQGTGVHLKALHSIGLGYLKDCLSLISSAHLTNLAKMACYECQGVTFGGS